MKRPIILEGQPFDWEAGAEHLMKVVDDTGQVSWGDALLADPGCFQCPRCGEWLWREGVKVKCPTCEAVIIVNHHN